MDFLFDAYSEALPRVEAWAAERFPRADGEPEAAHARSIRAKALDLLRGLLPAASLSHMGIFASGQAYEQLLLRLFASPLPEARDYARMILEELKAVVPSFVARVERPDRGGEWIEYLEERERGGRALGRAARPRPRPPRREPRARRCRLLSARGSEEELLAALAVRGGRRLGGRGARRAPQPAARRARGDAGRAGGRAAQPPPPPRPRLRGAQLPLRGRLRLRRLPRPPAPPDAHGPVADARPRARRRRARGARRRRASATPTARASSARARSTPASSGSAGPELAPYALASATGSATCST